MDNREKLNELLKKKHAIYKDFFNTENGKEILKDLEEKYYINRSSMSMVSGVDSVSVACREAQRAVVLYLRNMGSGKQITREEVENADNK